MQVLNVKRNHQIEQWYRSLQEVSYDDQADFEVMLLDARHPADASSALVGIALNIYEKGMRDDIVRLLFEASHSDNEHCLQLQAISHILALCWIYDDAVRHSTNIQEMLLDLLADHPNELPHYLRTLSKGKKHLLHMSDVKDVKQTLLYHLLVVDAASHALFD